MFCCDLLLQCCSTFSLRSLQRCVTCLYIWKSYSEAVNCVFARRSTWSWLRWLVSLAVNFATPILLAVLNRLFVCMCFFFPLKNSFWVQTPVKSSYRASMMFLKIAVLRGWQGRTRRALLEFREVETYLWIEIDKADSSNMDGWEGMVVKHLMPF